MPLALYRSMRRRDVCAALAELDLRLDGDAPVPRACAPRKAAAMLSAISERAGALGAPPVESLPRRLEHRSAGMFLAAVEDQIELLEAASAPPVITSGAAASVAENTALAFALTADKAATWSISGGADQAQFEVSGATLRWSGNGTRNHEAPADADANNVYQVVVRATGADGAADKAVSVTVTDAVDYEGWSGPGWFDASDAATISLSGDQVTAIANKRSGGGNLTKSGTAQNITRVAGAQNGRAAIRVARDVSSSAAVPHLAASAADPISTMCQGDDKPYTVIAAYKPSDTNTGYVWSWSDTLNATDSQRIALLSRNASASVRRSLATAALNDVTWGSGQASGTPRVVAAKFTGTALSVWDNSLTKVVNAAAQNVAAFNAELVFRLFASEINNASDPTVDQVQRAMDFYEIVVVDSAKSDADVQEAIQDIADKWGVTLS